MTFFRLEKICQRAVFKWGDRHGCVVMGHTFGLLGLIQLLELEQRLRNLEILRLLQTSFVQATKWWKIIV